MDANANFLHKYAKRMHKLVGNVDFVEGLRGKTWMAFIFGEDEQLEGHLNRAARFCFNFLLFLLLDMCQNGEIPNLPELLLK